MVVARVAQTSRSRAASLLRTIQLHPPSCPCHGNPMHPHNFAKAAATASRFIGTPGTEANRQKEYAFEMAGMEPSALIALADYITSFEYTLWSWIYEGSWYGFREYESKEGLDPHRQDDFPAPPYESCYRCARQNGHKIRNL